jgi:hypothetical protein
VKRHPGFSALIFRPEEMSPMFSFLPSSMGPASRRKANRPGDSGRPRPRASFVPRLERLEDRLCPSTLTVINNADSGAGSLRAVLAAAQNGDSIDFATNLSGQTIALTSGELDITRNITISGLGAGKLTVSGRGISRVFAVPSGVTASISRLTIADGYADQGGGLSNSGNLTLAQVALTSNEVSGDSAFSGVGGAIFNDAGATLNVLQSLFECNQVIGGTGIGFGGGIFNLGTVTIAGSTFDRNTALGGLEDLVIGQGGQGGAIDNQNNGSVTITASTFTNNQAEQGQATYGIGAAIDSENGTSLTVSDSAFTGNTASGSVFGSGGAVFSYAGSMAFSNCSFAGNQVTSAGFSDGGALEDQAGPAMLTNCTFTDNRDIGTDGASTGAAAVSNVLQGAQMTMTSCVLSGNLSQAGYGADGVNSFGQANGGAIFNGYQSVLTVTNCTIENNAAQGGNQSNNSGAPTPDSAYVGIAFGAAVFSFSGSTLNISGSTIAGNQAISGSSSIGPGAVAFGGAIDSDTGTTLNVSNTSFLGNRVVGGAGAAGNQGGTALGGAIIAQNSTTATIDHCLFAGNEAVGGAGGSGGVGGNALGGAIVVGRGVGLFSFADTTTLAISHSLLIGNLAQGGAGGAGANGGNGIGGGIFLGQLEGGPSASSLAATNTLIILDQSVGGAGGSGANGGNGLGGGLYASAGSTASLQQSTLAGDRALGGKGGTDAQGIGGGVYVESGATVGGTKTSIGGNFASTFDSDIFGVFSSQC